MRVLLDECVPRALRNDLPGHEVKTVAELGWAASRMANCCDVLQPGSMF
jgi:hypothetical protein